MGRKGGRCLLTYLNWKGGNIDIGITHVEKVAGLSSLRKRGGSQLGRELEHVKSKGKEEQQYFIQEERLPQRKRGGPTPYKDFAGERRELHIVQRKMKLGG